MKRTLAFSIGMLVACMAGTSLAEATEAQTQQPPVASDQTLAPAKPTLTATSKKSTNPHMELLSPIKRKDVDINRLSLHPCGGTKSGPVHYETTPGSRNMIAWRIHTPSPTGRCVIRVSDSPKEKDMVIAKPLDGSAGDDGSFPCGRETTPFEAKEIKVPKDLVCDQCILQLVWMTEEGDQYRCTDFESVSAEVPECFGQCLNAGICRNGRCACPEGFSGSNCQFEEETEEGGESVMQVIMDDSVILIVYAIMLAVIIGLFVGAYILYQRRMQQNRVVRDDQDKLTSNVGGPLAESRFAHLDK